MTTPISSGNATRPSTISNQLVAQDVPANPTATPTEPTQGTSLFEGSDFTETQANPRNLPPIEPGQIFEYDRFSGGASVTIPLSGDGNPTVSVDAARTTGTSERNQDGTYNVRQSTLSGTATVGDQTSLNVRYENRNQQLNSDGQVNQDFSYYVQGGINQTQGANVEAGALYRNGDLSAAGRVNVSANDGVRYNGALQYNATPTTGIGVSVSNDGGTTRNDVEVRGVVRQNITRDLSISGDVSPSGEARAMLNFNRKF